MVLAFNSGGETIANLLTRLLDEGYDATAGRVVDSIAAETNSGVLQLRLKQLEDEAARLAADGQALTLDNPVFRALVADLETTVQSSVLRMNNAASSVIQSGVDAGGQVQQRMAGLTVGWNQPDPEAIHQLVGFVDSSQFADMLSGYSEQVVGVVVNQAIRGSVEGWSPGRMAREIQARVEGFPAALANTLMRTLQLQSYRSSTAIYQNANTDVITRVYRMAALDDRCCLACVALSGTVIWDSERDAGRPIPRIYDHWNGRCTSVVDTGVREVRVRNGIDWFNRQPRSRQLTLAGGANMRALDAGRVTLNDFVHQVNDPVFGEMITEASLVGILGDGAREFYRR